MSPTFRALLAVALLLFLPACATVGNPGPPSMPAARAALAPEYRIFYDSLEEDGDWTLIEPYGYVFRPRVNFVAWSPYERGFWVPSDVYGWVWISTETFGWATYHYGRWMYDDYQGWVWLPGLDWGPAWVTWELSSQYVGWAPLVPEGGRLPEGAMRWAPIGALARADVSTRMVPASQIREEIANARTVRNVVERDGVRFNAGPPVEVVERVAGALPRVKIEGPAAREGRGDRGAAGDLTSRIEATRRAGADAAREAGLIARTGGALPSRVPIVRPELPARPSGEGRQGAEQRPGRGRGRTAPADTTRR